MCAPQCSPRDRYKSFDDVTTQNAATETLFGEDGSVQLGKAKALARTFARAVAGRPSSMSFDALTGHFALTFQVEASVSGNTEVRSCVHAPSNFSPFVWNNVSTKCKRRFVRICEQILFSILCFKFFDTC